MLSLLKRKIRVLLQLLVGDHLFRSQRMPPADKHMRLRHKQQMKLQILRFQQFLQHRLIEIIQKQNTDLAAHPGHILDDLIGLRLPEAEIVSILAVLLDQIHKGVHRKGIMLGRHAELLLPAVPVFVFILQDRRLLQHLPGIPQEILALPGKRDALVCPVKNHNMHLFFQFVNGVRQTGLGDVQPVGRLRDRSRLRHGNDVF